MPGDRTEQATPHRREKARREGDLLHSRELTTAAGTLAGILAFDVLANRSLDAWRDGFRGFLALGAGAGWETGNVGLTVVALRRLALGVLMPVAIVMLAVAGAAL